MSKNTALKYLYCYSNQITSLDVSKNTALTYLDCCFNQLTSLDVSQNTSLAILYCYNNQLTTLDVSQNTYLAILYCDNNQLTTLDVSQNTSLEQLYCYNNPLTTLDVSKNTALEYLYCNSNKLTTLDVSQNTALTQLYCYNNQLRFSTLPLRQPSWTDYYYSPQAKLSLPKTEYELNEEIDLSSQLTAGGNTTVYTWKTAGGITLVKDVDYTESNGKFTFLKQSGDYFYCEMTNATFPDLTLTTENISIPQTEPAITMTTTTPAGSTFSFEIAATADNSPIQVDWGSGTLASYTIGTNNSTVSGTLTGSDIKIYGVGINYLDLYDKKLTSLDVTNNTALTKLSCGDNQLTTLNVTNNTVLINLACSNNQLTSLDVTQNAALIDLYCGYNQLTTLDVTSNTALTTLSCSDNQLSSLDVSQNAALTYFYCYNNQLTSLDVSKNTALTDLNCESNQLTSLDVTNDTALTYLDCSSNQLITLDVTSNTALTHLSCDYNKLTTLDVSKNTALTDLDCAYNQLTTLDVTQNTALSYLYCYNNQLTTLDVTQNAALTHLGCSSNQLTTLDVSNNTALTSLYCYNNQLRFSTLPLRQPSWLNYSYSPQAKVELAKKQYGLTETVDLSSELTVDGKTTSYIWKTKGGATLVAGTDYNVTGGVTTFLKVQSDSVYCQMTNATFPELTLTTTNIKVSQFPLSVGNNEVAVKIYPNPATDNFSIEMAEEIVKVEVYTLTGVKVFENGLYNSTRVTVPTGSMPKGALVVRTYTRNGVYESKVIKI